MIVIDLLIGAYLIYKVSRGFINGFISELTSLLSIFIALYAAIHFYDYTLSFMQLFIKAEGNDALIFSRVITFILLLMLVIIIGNTITKLVDLAQMGLFNKILGSIFGFLKGILIMSIFINIFSKFNAFISIVPPQHLTESKLYYPMMKITHQIFPTYGAWYEYLIPEPSEEQKQKLSEDQKDKK